MAILGFEVEEIARLLALVDARQWEDFILEEEGRMLRIRGPRPAAPSVAPPAGAENQSRPSQPPAQAAPALPAGRKPRSARNNGKVDAIQAGHVALEAPMVGVFYRANSPGAPPLIKPGDHISVGQTIGIIEAMKIFSEIPAEHAGVVVSVPAQDGQLVQSGTPLVILKSSV